MNYGISAKFKKAKPGDLFMETVAQNAAGPINPEPRVLIFNNIIFSNSATKPDRIKFTCRETEKTVHINADDRYGRYPKLTDSKIDALVARRDQLKAEMECIEHVLRLINY